MSRRPGIRAHYERGLGAAMRYNQVAYAYSVTITATFGVLSKEQHAPDVLECFLFVIGAGVAYSGINVVVTRGFTERFPREPSEVVALGVALSFFSTCVALGVAALISRGLDGWPAWPIGSFGASVVFLLGAGAELAIAGWRHDAGGIGGEFDEDPSG
jgi:hypothetical protein